MVSLVLNEVMALKLLLTSKQTKANLAFQEFFMPIYLPKLLHIPS